jgi:hypothetical protein
MSGISEIKKKAKLSMDEMFDSQSVGKLDNHKDGNPERKTSIQLESQLNNNSFFQEYGQPVSYNDGQPTIHQSGKLESHPGIKQESQVAKQLTQFPTTKQQIVKPQIYKMTFNLSEDIYKAFNDLYANRMIEGRKTEKSELICEAIQWLIKMEQQQKNN